MLKLVDNGSVFVDEMKHLAVDFGTILSKAGLPPVTLKEGDSMMSVISAFKRYYLEVENSDLNLRTHMFGGFAVVIVMEAFRKYYCLVEQSALSMQGNGKDIEEVSSEKSSPLQKLGFPPDLAKPTSCRDTSNMTQVDTLPNVGMSMSTSKLKKSKETTSKKISTAKKHTSRVGDISFSTSSDDSDHMSKKRKISDDRIPNTQTIVGQLQKLDLSPSQMEHVLRANRKGRQGKSRLSLHRKAHQCAGSSTYCEIGSSSENDILGSDQEMQPHEEDLYTERKLHTAASSGENPAASYESDGEWDTIDLTTSQVKNLDKLEEAATKAFQGFIKEGLESDEDVQYIDTLVSGLYEGIHSLAESIKEEFISPIDLEADNKSAIGDEEKLVLVREKICNVYMSGMCTAKNIWRHF